MLLDLVKTPVRIEHLNVRSQMVGDEEITAMDIKLRADLPNSTLDGFSPGLRGSLYAPPDDPNMPVPGTDEDHLTHVRFPQLGMQHWSGDYRPVSLYVHVGGKPKDDILFNDATVGKIGFEVKEGGTVSFVWRVQVLPNEQDAARLVMLLKHEVRMTQEMTEAESTGDRDEDE